jgi:hypothetical protein
LGYLRLPAELMKSASEVQSTNKGIKVREIPGQAQGGVDLLQGLIRITKKPQDYGCKELASHPGVIPVAKGQRAMLLSVIESEPLL